MEKRADDQATIRQFGTVGTVGQVDKERHGEFPEGTIRDTLDNIPIVVTLLVLANVAAAAAIGRGTYELVKRARARSTSQTHH